MNLSFWNSIFEKVTHLVPHSTKRKVTPRAGWGIQAEHLEQRALLSAVMHHGRDSAIAADVAVAQQKQSSTYPNLNGNWNLAGTNGTVFTGTVNFQQSSSDELTGTINVPNSLPTTIEAHRSNRAVKLEVKPGAGEDVNVRGRFNANHDSITIHSVVKQPEGGRTRLTTVIAFNSNSNPTSFTVTISDKNGVVASVTGTKVLEL